MTNSMFANQTTTNSSKGANQLSMTAELTTTASNIANNVFKAVMDDQEKWIDSIKESQKSHEAMDELINEFELVGPFDHLFLMVKEGDIDTENHKETEDEFKIRYAKNYSELEKMLRSQQSKRSRCKGKIMTQANYLQMMTAAVAEGLIRSALGKEKSAGGNGVRRTSVKYSDEELQALKEDQDKLKKAIRNIQSKKSIMKSKANYDPTSDAWNELLVAEEQLKSQRIGGKGTSTVTVVKEVVKEVIPQEVTEMLNEVDDISKLKPKDSKALLNKIKEALLGK